MEQMIAKISHHIRSSKTLTAEIIISALISYPVAFYFLHKFIGEHAFILSFVPVILAGAFFRLRSIIYTVVLVWFINAGINIFTGESYFQSIGEGAFDVIAGFSIAVVVYLLRNENKKLRDEIAERSQDEGMHLERERQFEESQRVARIGSWERNIATNKMTWSKELYCIFDFDPKETPLNYETLLNAVHPDDRESFLMAGAAAIYDNKPYSIDFRIIRRNGTVLAIHSCGEIICDEAGNPAVFRGTAQDITWRKMNEAALKESEEKISAIMDAALDAVIMIDGDSHISLWNRAAERIFGYLSREAAGKNMLELIVPHRFYLPYLKGLSSFGTTGQGPLIGKTAEFMAIGKNGSEFPVEISFSAVKLSGKWHAIGIARDVKARRQMEEALRESESKFRNLAEKALVGIYFIQDGIFRYVNPMMTAIFGYGYEELINTKGPLDLAVMEDKPAIMSNLKKLLDGKTQYIHYNFDGVTKTGKTVHVEAYGSGTLHQGRPAVMGTLMDVTRREQAERHSLAQRTELSTLYKVSSAITGTLDMNDLFTKVLNTIVELDILKVEHKCGIFIVDGVRMRLASHLGHSESFLALHKDMTTDDCLCGLAARTGQIIVSKNCRNDVRHSIQCPGMLHHGHVILPLKAVDKVVGVIYLYTPVDFEINKRTMQTLFTIGNQIGMAINNCQLYEKTKALSLHDSLTNLANRNLMSAELDKMFERSKRDGSTFSAIMIDLDHFKKYNDTYGHNIGDMLLVEIANIFLKEVRAMDLIIRYGGEEFLILLPDTEKAQALEIAERTRNAVAAKTAVTISAGVSSYRKEMQKKEDIIDESDRALYRAKQQGRNRVEANPY